MGTRFQLTMAGDHLFYPGRIRDISRGGVKILVERRLEPGTVVKVMMLQPVKAQVAHCTPQQNGDLAVGLTFNKVITLPEMLSFLERQTSSQWSDTSPMVMSLHN
jgi:hypothetical protein